jgi:hypothetical protein
MKSRYLFYAILILTLAVSCDKTDIDPAAVVDLGYSYYPNDSGLYKIFEVEEIQYNDFQQTIDTVNYQIMEVIASSFIDLEGREARRVERYRLRNGTWQKFDVYQSIKTNLRVEEVDDNLRTVKLVFPIDEGIIWNGNAFNNQGDHHYEVLSEIEDTAINSINITSMLTIENLRDENILERHVQIEKYGKNLGLIHRYFVNLNLQKDSGIIRKTWIKEAGQYFSF